MRTAQDRITELNSVQKYAGSSMTVKLHAKNGYFDYEVYFTMETNEKKELPWIDWHLFNLKRNTGNQKIVLTEEYCNGKTVQASIDRQCVVVTGKYNGEDPEELIKQAESIVGKWQCGRQVRSPIT